MPKLRLVLLLLIVLLPLGIAAAQPPAPDATAVAEREAIDILARRHLLPAHDATQTPTMAATSVLQKGTTAALEPAGIIAYASDRRGNSDLLAQEVGGEVQTLIDDGAQDLTPAWSPDGRRLLFVSDRDGDYDIYLRHADGRISNLTDTTADDIHPAWSPDGQRVVFSSNRGGERFQIFSMRSDGSDVRQVAVIAGNHALAPRYAPNGTRIAFMRASLLTPSCTWNWDVWLMDIDGSDQRRMTTQLGGDLYPQWAPDGRIIYSSCRNLLDADLYLVNPDTGAEERLNSWTFSDELNATYAPDGEHIAFSSDVEGNPEIYVASLSAGTAQNLTRNAATDVTPDWVDPQAPPLPTHAVTGLVKDEEGKPLAGVVIRDNVGHTAVTNGQGRYRLTGLAGGTYEIRAAREGIAFMPPLQVVSVPPDATAATFVGRSCARATATTPLMLVTGWSGSADKLTLADDEQLKFFVDFDELDGLTGHLSDYGYVEGCNLFYATGTSPYLPLYGRSGERSNASVLRDNLCAAYPLVAQTIGGWSGSFSVIGHSYGGLRARALVESRDLYERDSANGRSGATCEGIPNRVRVDNIFTLGTPHGGEWGLLPFDLVIGVEALLGDTTPALDPELPAIWEILPPVRLAQNLLHSQPPGVTYYLLGGDARQQMLDPDWGWLVSLLVLGWPYETVRTEANDLAVHRDSAQALGDFPFVLRYPRVQQVDTPDLHGQVPAIDLRSYVNPAATFRTAICNALGLPGCEPSPSVVETAVPVPAAPSVMQRIAQLSQPQTTSGGALQDVAAGRLEAGQTVSGVFTLASEAPAQVMLAWSGGEVTLELVDPQGNPVNASTAVTDPDVEHFVFGGGLGLTNFTHLAAPLAGEWRYTLRAGDLERPAVYRLALARSTPIGITTTLPEWVAHGDALPITARVTHAATTLLDVALTARVSRPDGRTATLTLLDDGQQGDGAAGDGIFGARLTQTDVGGVYGVLLTAAGTSAGEAFTRTATAYVTVAPDTARLTDRIGDRAVPTNDTVGLDAALAVEAEVDVRQAGTYTLAADLYRGDDFVAAATTTGTLEAGNHTLTLSFDGTAVRASGLDGPYTVRNLLLVDESQVVLLIEAVEVAHTTAAYRHDQFGAPQRIFLPQIVGGN